MQTEINDLSAELYTNSSVYGEKGCWAKVLVVGFPLASPCPLGEKSITWNRPLVILTILLPLDLSNPDCDDRKVMRKGFISPQWWLGYARIQYKLPEISKWFLSNLGSFWLPQHIVRFSEGNIKAISALINGLVIVPVALVGVWDTTNGWGGIKYCNLGVTA